MNTLAAAELGVIAVNIVVLALGTHTLLLGDAARRKYDALINGHDRVRLKIMENATAMAARDTDEAAADGPTQAQKDASELDALRKKDAAAGREDYARRLAAARQAIELPANPFRIIHNSRDGLWRCEEAWISDNYEPRGYDEKWKTGVGYVGMDEWSSAAWACEIPAPSLRWRQIGPVPPKFVAREGIISSSDPNFREPFGSFAEAERWLKAYLVPVAEEVYFGPDGQRAKP